MDFDTAFERLIGHEGGYVNDPRDPGGETKFGISKRAYPGENIASLTLERAKELYRRDYWCPAGCDAVPVAIRFDLFDMAVNAGVKAAVRTLQLAAGADADCVLGTKTLQAVNYTDGGKLLARFNGQRLKLLADLPTWDRFGRGWARRIASNLLEA
ncbi:MAG: hypothetical protein RJA36_910 [Pseudomonadota bacterium]|jgi:lysozyme family protein